MGAMNGLKALAVAFVLFALAFGSGFQLLFRLAYAVLALVIASFLWTLLSTVGLRLSRETGAHRAQAGQVLEERLTVRNRLPIPRIWLELRDHSTLPAHRVSRAFGLGPFSVKSWTVRTHLTRRGLYRVGGVTVSGGDPFGLFRRSKFFPLSQKLIVYPATVDLQFGVQLGKLPGGMTLRQRTHYITPNSLGIRPYAPGDSLNRIHWPSTARLGSLTVKEFELDPLSDIWIVLDCEQAVHFGRGDDSTEEYSVSAAASLAKHFLARQRSVGLIAYGWQVTVLPADRGDRQLIKILEELAIARAGGRVPLAEVIAGESVRFGRNTTLIAITPSTAEQWTTGLRHEAERGVRCVVVRLDASTFGALGGTKEMSTALGQIPTFRISRGDNLASALSGPQDVGWLR